MTPLPSTMCFRAVLACSLVVVAACGKAAPASSAADVPPVRAIPVLAAIPPGTLSVEQATAAAPGAPVRVAAVLVAPMPQCPPCPSGANCSACLTYATYKSVTGDAKLAVSPGGASRLTAGAVYVLVGILDASVGFRQLRYERISRVVDIPDPSGTPFGLPPRRVLETHGVPPGVLRVEDAEGYGDEQMLRMVATFRAPAPRCPPCPAGAACSPCQDPHAAFSGADGQHAFSALVGLDLDKEPVGGQYVIEGSWGGDGSGRRLFRVNIMARVVR